MTPTFINKPTSFESTYTRWLFHLDSNTSREGVGGTLLQKQGNEW